MTAAIAGLPPGVNPANVRRAYEVKPVKRKRTVVHFTKDSEGRLVRHDDEQAADGFMVYFPQRHSIFVESKARLTEMGLHHASGLVDMETGMPIETISVPSIADLSDTEQE
jgi:hypothetical protein